MSRTWLAVLKLRITAPPLRAHASATRRDRAAFSSMLPSGAGHDRRVNKYLSPSVMPQLALVLAPTPLGSKPTMS